MKKIYLANILVFLSAFAVNISAEDLDQPPPMPPPISAPGAASAASTMPAAPPMDPTLAFFSALGSCTPGNYTEKNILATEVGQSMLNQQIFGPSNDNLSCNVTLSTPDNRTMSCAFPMSQLTLFNDSHFMQGMLADTADEPSEDSLNADLHWSQLKANNCELD